MRAATSPRVRAALRPSTRLSRVRTSRATHTRAEPSKSEEKASKDAQDLDDAFAIDLSVDVEKEFKRGLEFGNTEVRARFRPEAISEVDRGLPIADSLVAVSAQVLVAVAALSAGNIPSWLAPIGPRWRGLAYLLPAIVHGAKLASVWVVGGLAGKAYERKAFDGTFREAMRRTVSGGCFAVGLLIFITQIEVAHKFHELGLGDPVLESSPEGDLVINGALSELLVDIFSEAGALLTWRAIRWNTSPTDPASLLEEEE